MVCGYPPRLSDKRIKQRITPEQLAELRPEQKEHLRQLWKPERGDLFYTQIDTDTFNDEPIETVVIDTDNEFIFDAFNCAFPKEKCLPLLSIGQMIEILRSKYQLNIYTVNNHWHIQLFDLDICANDEVDCIRENGSNELCDALWEALKAVLIDAI